MLEDIQDAKGGVAKVGRVHGKGQGQNLASSSWVLATACTKLRPPRQAHAETCDEVLKELGLENDPLFALAKQLEKIALEDDYFVQRKLYPNVDFYSGIVQRAIGIPTKLFTGILPWPARSAGLPN